MGTPDDGIAVGHYMNIECGIYDEFHKDSLVASRFDLRKVLRK